MGWAETSCMGWVGHWVEMGFKASGPGRVGFTANAGWGGSDWVTLGTSGRCCPLPAHAERERQRRRPAAAAAVPAGPPPTTSVDQGAPPSPPILSPASSPSLPKYGAPSSYFAAPPPWPPGVATGGDPCWGCAGATPPPFFGAAYLVFYSVTK